MKPILLNISFILFWAASAIGQEIVLEATVNPQTVEVGQRFQLSYTLNTNGGKFQSPNLSEFQVLSGPNQSQNMSWVNGNMSASTTISYVLVATKTGTFEIPAAGMVAGGKLIKSNSVKIKVVKSNQTNQQKPQSNQQNTNN